YPVTGLRLVTPGAREVYLSGGERAAAVICCRRTLDQLLLERARSLGVRFVPNFTAAELLSEGAGTAGFVARDGRPVRARLTFLARHYAARLRGARQVGGFKGHPIAYTFKVGRLWGPGRLVIGEAGRMVHPATAEGISQGMRSGMFAAEALADVIRGGVAPETA